MGTERCINVVSWVKYGRKVGDVIHNVVPPIISGTEPGKATGFKFGQYIQRVHPNISPFKILEKREGGRIRCGPCMVATLRSIVVRCGPLWSVVAVVVISHTDRIVLCGTRNFVYFAVILIWNVALVIRSPNSAKCCCAYAYALCQ